ncbi:glycosyltransferase family 4 protein [Chloroflexia bacterium SDU3-3]|nr:glycosyltransferase family 4 protein [Chloroflexia bacterium SDU3-3]
MSHLLLIVPWLSMGGADKFNLDLLRQLALRGWGATLVTTQESEHPWRELFASACDDIVDLASTPAPQRPEQLAELATSRRADVVLIAHSDFGYHALPYLRARHPSAAYVDYCHMEEQWGDGGYPRLSLDASAWLDLQIVSSSHLREWYIERGGQPDQVAVATTNIDPADWDAARYRRADIRAALGVAQSAPVALYAGRLARQKQPLLAMDVLREVALAHPDAVFLIAGDGQFAPYVRGFVRAQRLGRQVRFLGAQPSARMRELLAASDVLFLPSQMEGISLAIYEAMAMGVVPLSAHVGGQAELVTPETGVLVRRGPDERAAYARQLRALLSDMERTRQLGAAARQRVAQHFRLDQMGERMDALLAEALRRHRQQPRPPISQAQAQESAHRARAEAMRNLQQSEQLNRPLRKRARQIFWWAVEHGAWPLVAIREKLKTQP